MVVVLVAAEELAVEARSMQLVPAFMFEGKSAACSTISAKGNIFNALPVACDGTDDLQPAPKSPHFVDRMCCLAREERCTLEGG